MTVCTLWYGVLSLNGSPLHNAFVRTLIDRPNLIEAYVPDCERPNDQSEQTHYEIVAADATGLIHYPRVGAQSYTFLEPRWVYVWRAFGMPSRMQLMVRCLPMCVRQLIVRLLLNRTFQRLYYSPVISACTDSDRLRYQQDKAARRLGWAKVWRLTSWLTISWDSILRARWGWGAGPDGTDVRLGCLRVQVI